MFQSHLFQVLALTAMEPPVAFEADAVSDEKNKVFRSIRPFPLDRLAKFVAIGQYGKGEVDGEPVPAYREEPGVSPYIDNAHLCSNEGLRGQLAVDRRPVLSAIR